MTWRSLPLAGAYEFTPAVFADDRGFFFEAFSMPRVVDGVGVDFSVAQVNMSHSVRGTIRGLHYAHVPPGQSKWVQCTEGEILDVLVDLRLGSSTFGQHAAVRLSASAHNAVFIPIGFGHAFQALSDSATVLYCVDQLYSPEREHGIHPLDPQLALPWEAIPPLLSDKDAAAPSFSAVQDSLPKLDACRAQEARRD